MSFMMVLINKGGGDGEVTLLVGKITLYWNRKE